MALVETHAPGRDQYLLAVTRRVEHYRRLQSVDRPEAVVTPAVDDDGLAALMRLRAAREHLAGAGFATAFVTVPTGFGWVGEMAATAAPATTWGLAFAGLTGAMGTVTVALAARRRRIARAAPAEPLYVRLSADLAAAWIDHRRARLALADLDDAADAYAAVLGTEQRLRAVLVALHVHALPDDEVGAARDWVYDTAARAHALHQVEVRRVALADQVRSTTLAVMPDADTAALDRAAEASLEISDAVQRALGDRA